MTLLVLLAAVDIGVEFRSPQAVPDDASASRLPHPPGKHVAVQGSTGSAELCLTILHDRFSLQSEERVVA